jgi:hypothetical protein
MSAFLPQGVQELGGTAHAHQQGRPTGPEPQLARSLSTAALGAAIRASGASSDHGQNARVSNLHAGFASPGAALKTRHAPSYRAVVAAAGSTGRPASPNLHGRTADRPHSKTERSFSVEIF